MQMMDNTGRNELKTAFKVSRQIWVPYPLEVCFAQMASQLEAPAKWDPFILHVWPLSPIRNQKGSISRILINLGGQIHTVCLAGILPIIPGSG